MDGGGGESLRADGVLADWTRRMRVQCGLSGAILCTSNAAEEQGIAGGNCAPQFSVLGGGGGTGNGGGCLNRALFYGGPARIRWPTIWLVYT